MTRKYSSTSVEQLLNATIASGDTTLSLASTAAVTSLLGGVTLAAGNVDQFTIVIDPDTASEEVIFVRGTSGSTLTGLVRGQAGTSATSHTAGATIKHVLTSNDLDFYTSGVDNALTAAGAATLTNKTIALGSNTVSGTTAQFNAALTDGDFATLAGTETLTNKNLTSSSNTFPSTLVTTTGTQTLTNKTIDYNSNTISNLPTGTSITLLSTNTVSSGSATYTVSSISGSYTDLFIEIYGITVSGGSNASEIRMYVGSGSNSNITTFAGYAENDATVGQVSKNYVALTGFVTSTAKPIKDSNSSNYWSISIPTYASTIRKSIIYSGTYTRPDNNIGQVFGGGGINYSSTSPVAISAITIETTAGTFGGGTVKIYGIK